MGTMPSDFSPALTTTTSSRISTIFPMTIAPGRRSFSVILCSNSSANDSVIGLEFSCKICAAPVHPAAFLFTVSAPDRQALVCHAGHRLGRDAGTGCLSHFSNLPGNQAQNTLNNLIDRQIRGINHYCIGRRNHRGDRSFTVSAVAFGKIAEKTGELDRKSTRLNSSHVAISYAV